MTGPEHYRRAEELLAEVTVDDGGISFGEGGEEYVSAAQVHAMLALAAAMGTFGDDASRTGPDDQEWDEAAGELSARRRREAAAAKRGVTS